METSEAAQKLIASLQRLSRTVESRQTADSAKGELFALTYLYEKDAVALPSEISAAMNVSTARIATLLNNLESRGLIRRMADKHDRRRVDVSLTKAGAKLVEERRGKIYGRISELVEALGEKDTLDYLRITERIIDFSNKNKKFRENAKHEA